MSYDDHRARDLNALLRNGKLNLESPLYLDPHVTDIEEVEDYAQKAASFLVKTYALDNLDLQDLHSIEDTEVIAYGDFTINATKEDEKTKRYLLALAQKYRLATDLTAQEDEEYTLGEASGSIASAMLHAMGYNLSFKKCATRISYVTAEYDEDGMMIVDKDTDSILIDTRTNNVEIFANATGEKYRNLLYSLAFVATGILMQDKEEESSGDTFHVSLKPENYAPISKVLLLIAEKVIHPPAAEVFRSIELQDEEDYFEVNRFNAVALGLRVK